MLSKTELTKETLNKLENTPKARRYMMNMIRMIRTANQSQKRPKAVIKRQVLTIFAEVCAQGHAVQSHVTSLVPGLCAVFLHFGNVRLCTFTHRVALGFTLLVGMLTEGSSNKPQI
ncbi:hypothetical protein GOODEAATRI_024973 [Goodea atripinnis]|uniref:Uncharacterized protein n=1 Tax=Goodea atripinnis TaxID=208336 RepID=A0ABV0PRF5_9TELE